MSRRPLRIAFALLVLILLASMAFRVAMLDKRADADVRTARAFDDTIGRLMTSVAELKAAEQAYVAAGQGESFWASRVTALVGSLTGELDEAKGTAGAGDAAARSSLGRAAERVNEFVEVDRRAREFAASGQTLMASDLIFGDGLEIATDLSALLATARDQARREHEVRSAALGRGRMLFLVVAVLAGCIGVLLLIPSWEPAPDSVSVVGRVPPGEDRTTDHQAPVSAEWRPPESAATAASHDAAGAATLRSAADLCTDFARVAEPEELQGLLERMAAVLDASGIIVWTSGAAAEPLRPVLSHGYAASALSRLAPIPRDGRNSVAAAYREARLDVVRTNGLVNGAIAAPIITPAGCVGVVAAEVRNGAECKTSLQALARIFAAQLATLLAPGTPATAPEAARDEGNLPSRSSSG